MSTDPMAEIRSALASNEASIRLVLTFTHGRCAQVYVGRKKVGPLLVSTEGQTLADVLAMLGNLAVDEPSSPTTTYASRTTSRNWPSEVQTVMDGIARRLTWPSMHWGTENVSPDAWPHIAAAALDAAQAVPRGGTS